MENAFYNKENLNPDIHEQKEEDNKITIPEGAETLNLFKWSGWRQKTKSHCKIMVYDK